MAIWPRPRFLERLSVLVAGVILLSPRAAAQTSPLPAQPPPALERAGRLLFDLPVPGGLSALFAAARVAPAPRSVALLSLIRVLYANAATGAESRRLSQAIEGLQGRAPVGSPSASDTVPLPLSPDVWTGTVFKNTVPADGLMYAILRDKRASLLYYGLASLDEPTLEFFDTHRPLLSAIYDLGVGPFATCARSIHIKDGVVVLPGGAADLPAWEDIVGERAARPERFVQALIGGEQGRRAYFLDLVTHLDVPRQAFALGAAFGDRRNRIVRALYSSVVDFEHKFWRFDVWPFARHAVDPAIVLMQVEALPDGRMKGPSRLAFWRAAFDGNEGACGKMDARDAATVDAAWLVERLMREPVDNRRLLVSALLFAQRVFSQQADAVSACQAVANFPRFSGLILTLEHMGFSDPAAYVSAVRLASAVASQPDLRNSLLGVAQVQGILAFLDAMSAASPSNRRTAQELVGSMCALVSPAGSGARSSSRITAVQRDSLAPGGGFPLNLLGLWVQKTLLRRLCSSNEPAESCMQAVAVGMRARLPSPSVIEWEGEYYRVDPSNAAALRLSQVRQRQDSLPFDVVLQLFAVGMALRDQRFPESTASEQAVFLTDLADRLPVGARTISGDAVDSIRSQLLRTAKQLTSARRKSTTAAEDVLDASYVLLADAWASFAYAMAIGDADSSFLLADDPARRHDFGLPPSASSLADLSAAWQLAHEEWRVRAGWTIRGGLLGLTRACALSWPRRLSIEPTTVRPTLTDVELHGIAESAAALTPFNATDAGRSNIAAAIQRGRAVLGTVASDPEQFAAHALEAGVSEWRVRGAVWTAQRDPDAVPELFSLAELLWMGSPDASSEHFDAWGAPSAPFDGSLVVRMPPRHAWEDLGGRNVASLYSHLADINLRAALWLDESKLPAVLMPGLVAFATWDLTTRAQPADMDDYLAVARAAQSIPSERFADYVSALTTDGTLTPVPKG